jgi:8-oxo-dGTP pyrophosphatase MutT (NUDIX family)
MAAMSSVLRSALEAHKELPLRLVVRVVIYKGNEICLCQKIKDGKLIALNFPGGGVEEGTDLAAMIKAVELEALEEVGIKVKNIESLGINSPAKHEMFNPKRVGVYSGTDTYYFKAEYAGEDKRYWNKEGDAMPYTWETPKEAIRKIEHGPESEFNGIRIQVLKAL